MRSLRTCGAGAPLSAPALPGHSSRIASITSAYSQIVDHPALNATRQGFLDALKAAGFVEGKNLTFEYQNAQGDVGNARNIADKFLADKVDLLAPCTTPSAQAAVSGARGSKIPVMFGCVTDPVAGRHRCSSLDKPYRHQRHRQLYGLPPVATAVRCVRGELCPNAKRFGTIYNAGESNSDDVREAAKAEAEKRGLAWVEIAISGSAEVKTAADSLVGRVDALLSCCRTTRWPRRSMRW